MKDYFDLKIKQFNWSISHYNPSVPTYRQKKLIETIYTDTENKKKEFEI